MDMLSVTPSLTEVNEPISYAARAKESLLTPVGKNLRSDQSRMFLSRVQGRIQIKTPAPQVIKDLNERLFDKRVELKVGLSQFAMHLSALQRGKTFDELDRLLDLEGWYEEDKLPEFSSFLDFLKWSIYAKSFDWTSLGVGDEGNLLAAWYFNGNILTANFGLGGVVRWTANLSLNGEMSHVVGESPLISFTKQFEFYISAMKSERSAD